MARSAARGAKASELSFESALSRLEAIVTELESGDLALDRALAAFEEGVALSRRCAAQLDDAERRIERLMDGAPADADDEGGPAAE